MDTLVTRPTSQYSSQDSLENINNQVPEEFGGLQRRQTEASPPQSPFSDLDRTNHFTARDMSRWTNQPATPSSINTASSSFAPFQPSSPLPPLPSPLPNDAAGPSIIRTRPLPVPPTARSTPFSVPPVVPYTGVPLQVLYQGKGENNEQGGLTIGNSSPNLNEGREAEDDEIEAHEEGSESERSDIDEGGQRMVPLPPYVRDVDSTFTLAGGPPGRPLSSDVLSLDTTDPTDHSRFSGSLHNQLHHHNSHDFSSEDLYEQNSQFVGRAASDAPRVPHPPLHDQDMISDAYEDDEEEDDESYTNYALLLHLAVLLRDKVSKSKHIKGSIPYPNAFTGKDIVSAIHAQITRELKENHGGAHQDRRPALLVARSLQSQLFFCEVEWCDRVLEDGVGDVYMFPDEYQDPCERTELPTGVITPLAKCYSPTCGNDDDYCYSYSCPRKGLRQLPPVKEALSGPQQEPWPTTVSRDLLNTLTYNEINRQTIIHNLLSKEEQYVHDLDLVEVIFINPLRHSGLSVASGNLHDFLDEIFGNLLQIRDVNKRLLEILRIRQREQAPVVRGIGDIFLDAVTTDFKEAYPTYIGYHSIAEKQVREELEKNPEFRLFVENCSRRQITRLGHSPRLDLKHLFNLPVEHLQKYRVLLEVIYKKTDPSNPDGDFLTEAIKALDKLNTLSQVCIFQETVMRGSTRKWEWPDLVTPPERQRFTGEEAKRQSIIFELIATEIDYVKDLLNANKMFITPLQEADPSIIPRDRLSQFLQDVFSNIQEITVYHQRLIEQLRYLQREYHPHISSITAAIFDTALNFREAYLEYIPKYPVAAYRIEDELQKNPNFKDFHDNVIRHLSANQLDMKYFVHRPIPRLQHYELLLQEIMQASPPGHEDRQTIPNVIEILKSIGKDAAPAVTSAEQKVDLWKYNSSIVFKPGEYYDMDLLNDSRSLIHAGWLHRRSEGGTTRNDWTELFVLLFDNYFVMTKPRMKDKVIEHHVTKQPIPLDLLSLVKFDESPLQCPSSSRRARRDNFRPPTSPTGSMHDRPGGADNNLLYPFKIYHNGRLGGPCTLFTESEKVRAEWQKRLEEALGLRRVIMESNKVFEMEILSQDMFLVSGAPNVPVVHPWGDTAVNGGRVTCSIPFVMPDGRKLVAIGCAEGVWIGFMHDPQTMRHVLHLHSVTQCAILEDFGLFLVLADKTLLAYHIEALVHTQYSSSLMSTDPQRLNASGSKDVQFFTVGTMYNRTLVIYARKRGNEFVFHALEPIADKISERQKANNGIAWPWQRNKSDWFRPYQTFLIASECYDLIFLTERVVIPCQKGFEIVQVEDRNTVTIPVIQDSRLSQRCGSCRPLGMFRVNNEFILCYNEFGLYVNPHGDPSRDNPTVEWEGKANRVALHAPYILLFDPRFIEVRHIETGRLSQIIQGHDVRCTWDGRGVDPSPEVIVNADGSDDNVCQDPKVHAVMNALEPRFPPGSKPNRATFQRVFELVPTLPLYLPDPIVSPPTVAYFHPSFSPPRSPPLRATNYRP